MLFIYGKNGDKYEVVNSADGTSRFLTLQELGAMTEGVKGFYDMEVNLNWIKAEMSKRLLMFHSFEFKELNLRLSKVTGLITCIDPCEKIYWRFMESTEFMYIMYSYKPTDLSSFDTSNVRCMRGMFRECNFQSLDISCLDTSKVTDMSGMFYKCSSLKTINLGNLDTSNVTDMSHMFGECRSLKSLDLSNFNTSKVTSMTSMFCNCESLETLNLDSFDTRNVTNMSVMFSRCFKLKSLDISGFDMTSAENIVYMFGDGTIHYHYILKYINSLHIMRFTGTGAAADTDETGPIGGLELLRKMEREVGMDFMSFTKEASLCRKALIEVLNTVKYSI